MIKQRKQNLPDSITSEDHELVGSIKRHRPDIRQRRDHLISVAHRFVLLIDVITWQFINGKQLLPLHTVLIFSLIIVTQWWCHLVNAYEVKASMVCLQCNNCVIHTSALQRQSSHNTNISSFTSFH